MVPYSKTKNILNLLSAFTLCCGMHTPSEIFFGYNKHFHLCELTPVIHQKMLITLLAS